METPVLHQLHCKRFLILDSHHLLSISSNVVWQPPALFLFVSQIQHAPVVRKPWRLRVGSRRSGRCHHRGQWHHRECGLIVSFSILLFSFSSLALSTFYIETAFIYPNPVLTPTSFFVCTNYTSLLLPLQPSFLHLYVHTLCFSSHSPLVVRTVGEHWSTPCTKGDDLHPANSLHRSRADR